MIFLFGFWFCCWGFFNFFNLPFLPSVFKWIWHFFTVLDSFPLCAHCCTFGLRIFLCPENETLSRDFKQWFLDTPVKNRRQMYYIKTCHKIEQIIDWNSPRCSFLKPSSSYSLVQITNTDEGCCRAEQVHARESSRGHLQHSEISHAWSSGGSFCQAWGHGKKCDLYICIFITYSTQTSPWCHWNDRSQVGVFFFTCRIMCAEGCVLLVIWVMKTNKEAQFKLNWL